MPNLNSLVLAAYRALPRCKYIVYGPAPRNRDASLAAYASQFDPRGYFLESSAEPYEVVGLVSDITEEDLMYVPEGVRADSSIVLVTQESFQLPGRCTRQLLNNYYFHYEDQQYKLSQRKKKGCLFRYICELDCKPDC